MIKSISLVLLLAATNASAGLIQHLVGNECLQKNVPSGMCAVLFDDDGCEGWEKPIPTGYGKLSFRYRNDAETVLVKKGCIFTGYDHHGSNEGARGQKVVIDARNFNKPHHKFQELDRKTLVDDISAVKCECPSSSAQTSSTQSKGPRGERPRPIDPNSNIPESQCPRISSTACAVLYDEENCVSDDWEPIILNNGEQRTFSLRSTLVNLKYKNDIESFVVRQGCTLEAYDDSDFSDDGIRASATQGDLLINLDTHRNRKYDSLHNDIESVRCNCH
eukprot:TRINITY_DN3300_c0_g1_i1.p1 TRINITY_DN3300_c0_g1~~TRINITY_DN3300_c0_g1_i1.p1  ORF type:complete len:276 (+),score=63.43 TRINITY_DN3300_c0_g1_i1:867-1694(+)